MIARSQNARLDFRINPEQKSLIERAASIEGRSVTDFAVSNLMRAAQETIERSTVTTLSERDAKAFLQMLDSKAGPNPALKAAAKRYMKSRGR